MIILNIMIIIIIAIVIVSISVIMIVILLFLLLSLFLYVDIYIYIYRERERVPDIPSSAIERGLPHCVVRRRGSPLPGPPSFSHWLWVALGLLPRRREVQTNSYYVGR